MFMWKALLVLVLCTAAAGGVDNGLATEPDPNRFAKEIEAFREWDSKNAIPAEPVLFVGSSSIRMWRTHDSFPGLPVINRGFGGSHVSDVIHFADRVVLPYKPKVIVFYAGDNDIAAGKSAQGVCDDCRRFATLVHAALPATRIIFIAIKPSEQRWSFEPEMTEANELVRAFCKKDEHLFFADLATPLRGPDGRPRSDLFLEDKLHLSPAGYAVWTAALTPVLRQALSPRPGDAAP